MTYLENQPSMSWWASSAHFTAPASSALYLTVHPCATPGNIFTKPSTCKELIILAFDWNRSHLITHTQPKIFKTKNIIITTTKNIKLVGEVWCYHQCSREWWILTVSVEKGCFCSSSFSILETENAANSCIAESRFWSWIIAYMVFHHAIQQNKETTKKKKKQTNDMLPDTNAKIILNPLGRLDIKWLAHLKGTTHPLLTYIVKIVKTEACPDNVWTKSVNIPQVMFLI